MNQKRDAFPGKFKPNRLGKLGIGLTMTLAASLAAEYAAAQAAVATSSCGYPLHTKPGHFETVPLGTPGKGYFHGGDGLDTVALDGPTHLIAGRGRLESVERIDVENGQFDTVVILAEFLATADRGEVDVRADWFDTTILDPRLQWERTPSASFSDELLKTQINGVDAQVRVPVGAFVVTGQDLPAITATEGPVGEYAWAPGTLAEPDDDGSGNDIQNISLRWANAGTARPDLSAIQLSAQKAKLDFRNGAANLIEIATGHLLSRDIGEIHLLTDEYDRLFIADPHCWARQGHTDPDMARLSSQQQDGRSVEIHLSKSLLSQSSDGQPRLGRAEHPGVWHLSHDTRQVLDAIDLRNAGKDYLILRNDMWLRRTPQPVILGDPGDEIWLDGSSGWSIAFNDQGLAASNPAGYQAAPLVIGVVPGLILRKMPMPEFLADPALLDLPHYPGTADKVREAGTIYVTRGGYVGLSAKQFANRKLIDLTNGRQNILRLHPADLDQTATDLEIRGDPDLDILSATEMPEPEIAADGTYVWRLPGPDGTRTITSKELSVIR
ncbi:hypothetical protein HW561_16815 [Rhodobacteraceae bacterium B1Z28]|uniref:Phytase-like protein with esterase activity n=1 Tax=Ruegeria haliotis TaxID=2747601 RepID=A0ABX2PTF5_9RHOB|nr:hypothetical protein [Ruegeria haliotis]NVO57460.1 hypothetical protein [Ruegeria haliotis]